MWAKESLCESDVKTAALREPVAKSAVSQAILALPFKAAAKILENRHRRAERLNRKRAAARRIPHLGVIVSHNLCRQHLYRVEHGLPASHELAEISKTETARKEAERAKRREKRAKEELLARLARECGYQN